MATRFSLSKLHASSRADSSSSISHTVGTAAVKVTPSRLQQFINTRAVELGARHHELAPHHRRNERNRPRIGVEHRHDRQHRHRDAPQPKHVRLVGRQRVQHVGAVRIEHALGIARGAGRVAKPRRPCSRRSRPTRRFAAGQDEILDTPPRS